VARRSSTSQGWRGRLFGVGVFVFVLLVVELAARIYVALATGASPFALSRTLEAFYPDIDHMAGKGIRRDDERYDVLLLGASALHRHWSAFEHVFQEELALRSGRTVQLWNASQPGHGSLDSRVKYQHVGSERFDLVVFYHGINELRANCCPASDFREDYSHIEWYRRVNWVNRHLRLLHWSGIPYVAHDAVMALEKATGRYRPIPFNRMNREEIEQGRELKTPPCFRRNLEAIVELARERGDPLLLMTYAWYLAPDYSYERFKRREAGYAIHRTELGTWGTPETIAAGLEAHNAVVRAVAEAHPEVHLLDQEAQIPGRREYWNDICHMTARGLIEFAANMGQLLETRGLLRRAAGE
jgi:hypothetical protein